MNYRKCGSFKCTATTKVSKGLVSVVKLSARAQAHEWDGQLMPAGILIATSASFPLVCSGRLCPLPPTTNANDHYDDDARSTRQETDKTGSNDGKKGVTRWTNTGTSKHYRLAQGEHPNLFHHDFTRRFLELDPEILRTYTMGYGENLD